MRASRTHAPQPLPLPLPPPPLSLPPTPSTIPRRRHRPTASSSSSLSSSSSSSVSTASFSPSPSPAPSPRADTATNTTSVVPFSWERHPGIPKSSLAGLISSSSGGGSAPLPLPPPLRRPAPPRRRRQRRRRRADLPPSPDPDAADPFAAAFVECTREEGTDDADADADVADKLWPAPTSSAFSGRAGRPRRLSGGGFVVGLLQLYGCKSTMDVADGAFLARRPVAAARPGPGRATRR